MNKRVATTLRDLAKHFRVKIKYVGGLPDRVYGFADPSPGCRSIVINANKPRSEHIFTILHEMAHFLLHLDNPHRRIVPWLFDRQYSSEFFAEIILRTKRWVYLKFGREWEADLWALAAFPMVGTRQDLGAFLNRHPEKLKWFFAVILGSLKVRIWKFFGKLLVDES